VAASFHRHPISVSNSHLMSCAMAVDSAEAVHRVRDEILATWGGVDVLINNAGLAADQLLSRMEEAAWDRVLSVNLKGAFLCARAVLPEMIRRQRGHLIHIGSYSGRQGAAGQGNYAAAKAGLLGLSAALAREGGPHNVRSNVLLPGVLPTGMTATLPAAQLRAFANANVLGRINSVAEVARFAAFLARLENVSGQVFQLDSRIVPWT